MRKLGKLTALMVVLIAGFSGCEDPITGENSEPITGKGAEMAKGQWSSLILNKAPEVYRFKQGQITKGQDFWDKPELLEGMELTLIYEDRKHTILRFPEDKAEIDKAVDVTVNELDENAVGPMIPLTFTFSKKPAYRNTDGAEELSYQFNVSILKLNHVRILPSEFTNTNIQREYKFDDTFKMVEEKLMEIQLQGIYGFESARLDDTYTEDDWETIPPETPRGLKEDSYIEGLTGSQTPQIGVLINSAGMYVYSQPYPIQVLPPE